MGKPWILWDLACGKPLHITNWKDPPFSMDTSFRLGHFLTGQFDREMENTVSEVGVVFSCSLWIQNDPNTSVVEQWYLVTVLKKIMNHAPHSEKGWIHQEFLNSSPFATLSNLQLTTSLTVR